jgi:hypothetical protein
LSRRAKAIVSRLLDGLPAAPGSLVGPFGIGIDAMVEPITLGMLLQGRAVIWLLVGDQRQSLSLG